MMRVPCTRDAVWRTAARPDSSSVADRATAERTDGGVERTRCADGSAEGCFAAGGRRWMRTLQGGPGFGSGGKEGLASPVSVLLRLPPLPLGH